MSYTRDELVTEIRAEADATGSGRWTPTTVLRKLDTVFAQEWGEILDEAPYYKLLELTVTPTAAGLVNLSAMRYPSLNVYLRRVLAVAVDDKVYEEGSPLSAPFATLVGGSPCVWYQRGQQLQILPPPASGAVVKVLFSCRPLLPSESPNTGSTAIDFPSGHEQVLILGTAAALLDKGGEESDAADALLTRQGAHRDRLLLEVGRIGGKPKRVLYSDTREDWAS